MEIRIMVVEDNHELADSLAQILVLEGYEARALYSAEVAHIIASDWVPDLAIIDLHLGEMTGLDFAILLKKKNPTCDILIFSGQEPTESFWIDAEQDGLKFQLLSKPLPPAVLVNKVSCMLRARSDADRILPR